MKENAVKIISVISGLCFISGLVWAGLSFKGALGFSNGSYDLSVNISADEIWQIYLMFGLIACGLIGLLIALAIYLRSFR